MLIQIYAEAPNPNNNNLQPKLLLLPNGKPMPVFREKLEEQNNKMARELRRIQFQLTLSQNSYTDEEIKGRTAAQAQASDALNRGEVVIVEIENTVIAGIISDIQQSRQNVHPSTPYSTTFQYDAARYTRLAPTNTGNNQTSENRQRQQYAQQ